MNISEWLVSAAVYAGLVVGAAFLRYRMTIKDGIPLRDTMSFGKYLPDYPKQNIISLGICTLLFFYASYFTTHRSRATCRGSTTRLAAMVSVQAVPIINSVRVGSIPATQVLGWVMGSEDGPPGYSWPLQPT